MALELTDADRSALHGELGQGKALAMSLVVKLAEISGATGLVDIVGAHIDGCLFHGQAGLDYVSRLGEDCEVAVPTTLNVSSLDLLHPDLYRGDADTARSARLLMDAHVALGCRPTWTCAPYQLPDRPALGDQVAWGESNAIVFANSVLGARTARYGDFADLACAITGRAPYSGLHTDAGRRATDIVDLSLLPDAWLDEETFYPVLGYWIGSKCGTGVPAIIGLESIGLESVDPDSDGADIRAGEDRLKAIGAAAASSGATAMFHAVGVTQEAPDVETVTRGEEVRKHDVQPADITRIRNRLGAEAGPIAAVSVGTPHMSLDELQSLADLVSGRRARVPFYANTARDTVAMLSEQRLRSLESFGVTLVTDTCTYITPISGDVEGAVMTNSGKWAYYAPGNLGVDVVFAGLAECVDSAENGSAVLGALFT